MYQSNYIQCTNSQLFSFMLIQKNDLNREFLYMKCALNVSPKRSSTFSTCSKVFASAHTLFHSQQAKGDARFRKCRQACAIQYYF